MIEIRFPPSGDSAKSVFLFFEQKTLGGKKIFLSITNEVVFDSVYGDIFIDGRDVAGQR